jgi:hypothetical protein
VAGLAEGGAGVAGAVRGVGEHLERSSFGVRVQQRSPTTASWLSSPQALVHRSRPAHRHAALLRTLLSTNWRMQNHSRIEIRFMIHVEFTV